MQRKSVDSPEPEGTIIQTTSPFAMSNDMPFSTSFSSNDLCRSTMRMIVLVRRPCLPCVHSS